MINCSSGQIAITIPDTLGGKPVTAIANGAFMDAWGVQKLIIPSSVTAIDEFAFHYLWNLKSIEAPNNQYFMSDGIGLYSADRSRLLKLYYNRVTYELPPTLKQIDRNALSEAGVYTYVVPETNASYCAIEGSLYSKDGSVLVKLAESVTTYRAPASLRSIVYHALVGTSPHELIFNEGLTKLENIDSSGRDESGYLYIPSTVTEIDLNCLTCTGVGRIEVSPDNPKFSSVDGVLFNKDQTELLRYPICRSGDYAVPDGTLKIGWGAFQLCSELTSLVLPTSLKQVERSAFISCEKLDNIVVCSAETEIPGSFVDPSYKCSPSLRVFAAPGSSAQEKAKALGVTTVDWDISQGIPELKPAEFDYVFNEDGTICITGWNTPCAELIIPETFDGHIITGIGDGFRYAVEYDIWYSITSVRLPSTLKTIGSYAFAYFGLTSIELPDSLTSIGSCAFAGCPIQGTLRLPAAVQSIANEAFINTLITDFDVSPDHPIYCSVNGMVLSKDQTHLCFYPYGREGTCIIPESVRIIDTYACSTGQLTDVVIHDQVQKIGISFSGSKLSGVVKIPASVTELDSRAFDSSQITGYQVDDANPGYCDIDGVLFTKDQKTLLSYPAGRTDESYTLPYGTETVMDCAFFNTQLLSLTIPETVVSLPYYSLGGTSLQSVTIQGSSTMLEENCFGWMPEEFTMRAYPGSTAESFAKQFGFAFIPIN